MALRAVFEASTKKFYFDELNRFFPVVGLTPLEIPRCGPSQDYGQWQASCLRAVLRAQYLQHAYARAYASLRTEGKTLRGPSDIGVPLLNWFWEVLPSAHVSFMWQAQHFVYIGHQQTALARASKCVPCGQRRILCPSEIKRVFHAAGAAAHVGRSISCTLPTQR